MSYREKYHDRKARGKCVECAGKDAIPGQVLCDGCSAGRQERKGVLIQFRVCTNCGSEPAMPNRKRCETCHKKLRKSVDTLLAKRRAAGKCVTCGADPSPGFKSCAKCRAYQRKRQREYYYVKRVCRDEIAERRQRRETEMETQDA